MKLGIDVSATTIATVLRRSGLGPAPRRLGPTWTQFLRAQASGLLSRESRADVQDSLLSSAVAPHQEAPVPDTDDPATAEDLDAIHDPSHRNGCPIPMVVARPPGPVTPTWPGGHARDGPRWPPETGRTPPGSTSNSNVSFVLIVASGRS